MRKVLEPPIRSALALSLPLITFCPSCFSQTCLALDWPGMAQRQFDLGSGEQNSIRYFAKFNRRKWPSHIDSKSARISNKFYVNFTYTWDIVFSRRHFRSCWFSSFLASCFVFSFAILYFLPICNLRWLSSTQNLFCTVRWAAIPAFRVPQHAQSP